MAFSLLNHSLKLNKPYPKILARSEVTKTLQHYFNGTTLSDSKKQKIA